MFDLKNPAIYFRIPIWWRARGFGYSPMEFTRICNRYRRGSTEKSDSADSHSDVCPYLIKYRRDMENSGCVRKLEF